MCAITYDDRPIRDCYNADLNNPGEAHRMATIVEPNLQQALRLLSLCRNQQAHNQATRIRRALSAYRIRRDQRLAA